MKQMLLFPDPRPLVDRLGPEFFRSAPTSPGVYLMRDAAESVLYIGKAKNLRKRLASYRVANPDRMKRRHLRLLRAVTRIDFEACDSENSALARESELLRTIRPKFNRAGTWPGKPRFLAWRMLNGTFEMAVTEAHIADWYIHGPLGSGAFRLRNCLARLVWRATWPERCISCMPAGWWHGKFQGITAISVGNLDRDLETVFTRALEGEAERFLQWLSERRPQHLHAFDRALLEADTESLTELL